MFDARRRISQIDLNRAGTALMEIVSEPDMRLVFLKFPQYLLTTILSSPEEAGDYVRTLQALLRSVGSSDGNMEQVKCSLQGGVALCELTLLERVR